MLNDDELAQKKVQYVGVIRGVLTIIDLQAFGEELLCIKTLQQSHKGQRRADCENEIVVKHFMSLRIVEVDHIIVWWQSKDVDAIDLVGPSHCCM